MCTNCTRETCVKVRVGREKQQSFPRCVVPVSGSRMRLMVQPNHRYFLFCIHGSSKDQKAQWSLLGDETETTNVFTERVFRMQLQVSQPQQRLTQFVWSPCLTLPRRRRRVGSLLVSRSSVVTFGPVSRRSHTDWVGTLGLVPARTNYGPPTRLPSFLPSFQEFK